ncbi:MAG: NTP transferase domain-containing protein [Candidatus Thermoplasmatota archaeon]|nr:NTP transferase domain-containing protein [Candidatus Thermoplasmatota archaeon]
MKAVILAAGEGTRLRPFTASEPKVMIPVANRPILEYVVESLIENGIRDIVMVVGYRRQRIMSYFGDGDDFGADIEYVVQKKQPPHGGTAHALYQAKEKIDDDFIVLPGDNVVSKNTISDLLEDITPPALLITRSDSPSKYGVVTLKKGKKEIDNLIEKPEESPSHLISTGIYSFTPKIFDYIDESMKERKYDLPSVVQKKMEDKEIRAIKTEATWIDAVYPWDLLHVNSVALGDMEKRINGLIGENVIIKGDVKIGEGTRIRGGTFIEGPAVIGEGCDIGPNACILPSTSIGDNAKIEPFTKVQNSVVMNGVQIGTNSTIENTVIGEGVRIGNNFSTFISDARVQGDDGFHEVREIGTMIAEDTEIDSGVIVEPGVIIGKNCEIRYGRTIRENIESEAKAI